MTQYTEKDMTPFFPADVKPAYVGMYERKYDFWEDLDARDYWNGEKWLPCLNGFWDGKDYPAQDDRPWRGLCFDPSKEAK